MHEVIKVYDALSDVIVLIIELIGFFSTFTKVETKQFYFVAELVCILNPQSN